MTQLTANGRSYSDDGSAPLDMRNGGWRQWMLLMLADVMHDTGANQTAAAASAGAASASEAAAANSANQAANYAAALTATSTSVLTVGSGAKALTVQAGKQFAEGQYVHIVRQGNIATWMNGQVQAYNGVSGALSVNVPTGSTSGTGTYSDWFVTLSGARGPAIESMPAMPRAARTGNTMLVATDRGGFIDITSGSFTQTFDTAANLGAGWWCVVRNAGTGDITIPSSDGVTNWIMYSGATRLFQCDGVSIYSVPLVGGRKYFNTTGNIVWAPGINTWAYDLQAGGAGAGGGARSTARWDGGGAGAGERKKGTVDVSEIVVGGTTLVTVGGKGTGGAAAAGDNAAGSDGTAGGDSSIGTLRIAEGGGKAGSTKATTSAHGGGSRGGGSGTCGATGGTAGGQTYTSQTAPGSSQWKNGTDWGGPSGRPGDDNGVALKAASGGQTGGRSGAAVAAGTAGADATTPGSGGSGGAGNVNGSPAGKGGDGAVGYATIVEVV